MPRARAAEAAYAALCLCALGASPSRFAQRSGRGGRREATQGVSSFPRQAWVQQVAQTIAQQVQPQHGQRNRHGHEGRHTDRELHVDQAGRRIGDDAVRNAVAILVMYALLFFVTGLAISRIESLPLPACLFETASTLGTVGLTLGITGTLSPASRLILIGLMFLGRVGGLTLIYAAESGRKTSMSTLPPEKILVG